MLMITLNALYLSALVCVSPLLLYRMFRHSRYRSGWQEKLLGLGRLDHRTLPESPVKTKSVPNGSAFSENPPASAANDSSLQSHALPDSQEYAMPATVWLHAVSVGEVQLLRTIINELLRTRPDLRLVVSTSTDSGYQLALKLYGESCSVTYAPLDFSWAIKNAWTRIQPSLILLAELEVWPNWMIHAHRMGVPVVIVNGRLSENSFKGYRRIQWLLRPAFQPIAFVASQNDTYTDRFIGLGIPKSRVSTTGSIKFDGAEPSRDVVDVTERRALLRLSTVSGPHSVPGSAKGPLVWVAGSTQEPEEELIIATYQNLVRTHPHLKLILVPRHPERFESVAQLLEKSGLRWARRSECQNRSPAEDWQVFLGDTVGELRWWWGLADIAFVGGSFGNRGGQNMIEPCAFGVATCFGPNTKNFRDIVQLLLQEQACVQLQSPEDLQPWLENMLNDSLARQKLGEHAGTVAAKHRGALERTMKVIHEFLPSQR